MRSFVLGAVAAVALLLASQPAEAQFWFFGDGFGSDSRGSARRAPRAFDDDDERRTAARPKLSKKAAKAAKAKKKALVKGPPVRQGGPRPAIAAVAPPVVSFAGSYAPGSVVIDTGGRALYYVLAGNRAYRYRIAVGRIGFTWFGTETVSRVADWPDWRPPKEMREREPHLPELMTGGLYNPLGAKSIYLGNTLYRIHGTNNAGSVGSASSSGCFRMTNGNVTHLASLVNIGAQVHVLRRLPAGVAGPSVASSG